MQASQSSSKTSSSTHGSGRTWLCRLAVASCLVLMLGGCATVRPDKKEFLAEPSMTWTSGGMAQTHEDHVLENREGSMGGSTTSGGGCGCN